MTEYCDEYRQFQLRFPVVNVLQIWDPLDVHFNQTANTFRNKIFHLIEYIHDGKHPSILDSLIKSIQVWIIFVLVACYRQILSPPLKLFNGRQLNNNQNVRRRLFSFLITLVRTWKTALLSRVFFFFVAFVIHFSCHHRVIF